MIAAEGIEPPTVWIALTCSTAELCDLYQSPLLTRLYRQVIDIGTTVGCENHNWKMLVDSVIESEIKISI